jgi:hypothetical protein
MNRHVEDTLEQIQNTLQTLNALGLSRSIKNPIISIDGQESIITWDNHVSGRHNSGKAFTTINQYVSIYEAGAYQCILYDGSIIRAYLKFDRNIMKQESFLFWPSPIFIPEEDIDELGIREAVNIYVSTQNSTTTELKMRSPIRLDFDPTHEKFLHPSTHLHMQHHECRMSVNRPCCFNTFIKFVFSNFYPDKELKEMKKLETLNYSGFELQSDAVISI